MLRYSKDLGSKGRRRPRKPLRRPQIGFEQLDVRRVLASISGTVFEDLDRSGDQGQGEPGLESRIVFFDFDGNSLVGRDEPFQLTGADGSFSFDNIEPRQTSYHVRMFLGTSRQSITQGESVQSVSIRDASDRAEISFGVSVAGTNSAPTSEDAERSVREDAGLVGQASSLTNLGTDAEQDFLVAIQSADETSGAIEIFPDGGFRFDPEPNFNGTATANYILHDGRNPSDEIQLTIHVQPVNDEPSGVELDADTLPENSAGGTVVGAMRVLDPRRVRSICIFY